MNQGFCSQEGCPLRKSQLPQELLHLGLLEREGVSCRAHLAWLSAWSFAVMEDSSSGDWAAALDL